MYLTYGYKRFVSVIKVIQLFICMFVYKFFLILVKKKNIVGNLNGLQKLELFVVFLFVFVFM